MAKLYPPNINGTIPAFCKDGTVLITVPFSMNKAVSKSEVMGFALKVKTVSGVVKGVIKTTTSSNSSYDIEENSSAIFDASHLDFSVGQYYKFQLAYVGTDGVVGYYSTVGVAKYTTMPSITIDGLKFGRINSHNYFYTGVYSQKNKDTTEKLYSTRFVLYDYDKAILQDSGEVLHNTSQDDLSYEAHATFSVPQDLELDKTYYIKFFIKTVNGLEKSTSYFRLMQRRSVSPEIEASLVATLQADEGYINLKIEDKVDAVISGAFLISRASSLNGYAWEELKRFDLQSMVPDKWSFLDCTVEQGASYKYSLQQYNSNGIYSDRIISNTVSVDFEDMFLFDGERQLNIRFNPKVSTYKIDKSETKQETMGSKYPFISRNGNIDYKEFAISGLISYKMDDVELFMTKDELGLGDIIDTNLTSENITAERIFKNKVLEWLNDGKPKVFRSPAEGNYIVRLMNVSLSPTDSLGRMLHTFSCTAYEIAEFNLTNLQYYGLVDVSDDFALQTRWKTIVLKDVDTKGNSTPGLLDNSSSGAYSVHFTEMMPGSMIYVDGQSIMIGATGSYYAEFPENPIYSVAFDYEEDMAGLFTYSYKSKSITVFGTIQDVSIIDVPAQQFIGDKYKNSLLFDKYGNGHTSNNIFDTLCDIKTEVLNAYRIKLQKREIQYLYLDLTYEQFQADGHTSVTNDLIKAYKLYDTMYCNSNSNEVIIDWSSKKGLDPWALYYIRFKKGSSTHTYPNEGYYIEANNESFAPYTGVAIDGNTYEIFNLSQDIFEAIINGESINLSDRDLPYEVLNQDFINSVIINKGIVAELSYSKQVIEYIFEESGSSSLIKAKKNFQLADNKLEEVLNDATDYDTILTYKNKRDDYYLIFIKLLNKEITKYKEENGILS